MKFPPFFPNSRNARGLPGLRHDDAHLPVDLSEADAAHEGAVRGEVVHHVRHVVVGGVSVLSPLLVMVGWDSSFSQEVCNVHIPSSAGEFPTGNRKEGSTGQY